MRRLILFALLAPLAISNAGCIMVLGIKELPNHGRVVEIDGDLYVVDLDSHRIRKIDVDPVIEIEEPGDLREDTGGD